MLCYRRYTLRDLIGKDQTVLSVAPRHMDSGLAMVSHPGQPYRGITRDQAALLLRSWRNTVAWRHAQSRYTLSRYERSR